MNYIFAMGSSKVQRFCIPNPKVPCSRPLGGLEVDSAFHPS